MQVCASCGGENPDAARYCSFCAAALTAPAPERRKLATLVFCDMSGSTAMGERVDAETVRELMLSYFHEMRGALERHGGTVEKFVGDAVLAVFGVPEAHEDDALRACRAALEMQARLASLNEQLEARYGTTIALRIGVNTGEVVAGDPASRETFVTGDAVNVAARLEQAAAPGEVLIGDSTFRLVREAVTVGAVEPLSAKGKSEPVAAYRLLDVSGLGPAPRRAAAPLVGREQELALLEREFEAAAAERSCRLVTIVGEPGVGKSRLAAELVDRIGPRARAVRGGCLSYGEGITYWAIQQIVRELAGIRDEHSPEDARAQLEALLAGAPDGEAVAAQIGQLLGIGEAVTSAEELRAAIVTLLAAAAGERPLLILVEDIHWAEPALLELLVHLSAGIGAPFLVVCLARPELLERDPGWKPTMPLEPLGEAELDLLLGSLGAPPAVRARLAQAAAGNPLFAEELVAMLVDEGVLRRDEDGGWVLKRALEAVALPVSLNALLGARLDRLDAQARDTLERGAIEGELFHRGAVVELTAPEARTAVRGRLEALADRDLVWPAAASFAGETAFRFKHFLIREATYRATAKKLRAVLHERFANWLERVVGERLVEYEEILAYHLEQSYDFRTELGPVDDEIRALGERAGEHLAAAAGRAAARGDYHAAVNLLERALTLGIGDSHKRVRAQVELAYLIRGTGRETEADAILAASLDEATDLGDRGVAALALVHQYGYRRMGDPEANPEKSRQVAEQAVETLTELGDAAGLAVAGRWLGLALRRQGRAAEACAAFEGALVHADAAGDQDARRQLSGSVGYALCDGPTPVDDAIRRCEELLQANPSNRATEVTITRFLSALHAMAARFEEAAKQARRGDLVLDELDDHHEPLAYRSVVAEAKELAGDRAGAEQELATMWQSYRDFGAFDPDAQGMRSAYQLALLYCDEGRWDDAGRCLEYGRDVPVPVFFRIEAVLGLAARARLTAHRGELTEAVTLARRAVELAERTDLLNLTARVWLALAEVQRRNGQAAEADAAIGTAIRCYEAKGNVAAAGQL